MGGENLMTSDNIVVKDTKSQVIVQNNAFLSSNSGLDSNASHHKLSTTSKSMATAEEINKHTTPTKTIKESYGELDNDIVSFEHINIHGINPRSQFVELTHTIGVLEKWEQDYFV